MFKRLTIVFALLTCGMVCCFAAKLQASGKDGFSKSSIDKIRQENLRLKHELLSIKDSLRSVSLFNKIAEQSNRDKQVEQEKQLLQKQDAFTQKEQEINKLYERLRLLYVVVVVAIVLCVILLVYLMYQIRKNRFEFTQSNDSLPDLEHNYRQKFIIENITARIEAQETERERISRELHDGIGGNLVAIRLLLQTVEVDNPVLNELQRLVANTQQEIRAISHNLAPPRFDETPFEQLFLHHIGHIKATTSIDIEGILLPMQGWSMLSIKLQTEIFRLIQELTGNIVKHAKATKVNISLRLEEDNVSLLAEDNGIGFIVEKGYEGIGLQNLKLRVAYLNGKIDINSTPGKGTIVMIEIPIKQP